MKPMFSQRTLFWLAMGLLVLATAAGLMSGLHAIGVDLIPWVPSLVWFIVGECAAILFIATLLLSASRQSH